MRNNIPQKVLKVEIFLKHEVHTKYVSAKLIWKTNYGSKDEPIKNQKGNDKSIR